MTPNLEEKKTTKLYPEITKTKKITWQELAKHNNREDSWIGIENKVYNITDWQHKHPGGTEIIELLAGKDATNVFMSYHKSSTEKLLGTAKVPLVGDLITSKLPRYVGDSGFYKTLKKRVEKHFKDSGIKDTRKMTPFVIFDGLFIHTLMILSLYYSLYHPGLPLYASLFFSVLNGVGHYLDMTHVVHDVCHGCYGHSKWLWKIIGVFGTCFTGQSLHVWNHRHVVGHHVYTNLSGVDPDIGIYRCTKKKPIMKYRQHISVLPTWFQPYLFLFINFHMKVDDWFSFFRGSMEHATINNRDYASTVKFLAGKFVHYIFRFILPVYLGRRSIGSTILNYIIYEITGGYLFGLFSQLSHVGSHTEYLAETPVARDWGEAQVITAVDYGHGNWFWTYVSGYLNYQVVHHLFPSVAPHYYPQLAPIIKKTCKEFGIDYKVRKFMDIYNEYLNHLKQFQYVRERSVEKIKKSWSPVDMLDVLFNDLDKKKTK